MYIREDSIVRSSHNILHFDLRIATEQSTTNPKMTEDIELEDCCLKHLHVQCIYNDVKYTGGRYDVVH